MKKIIVLILIIVVLAIILVARGRKQVTYFEDVESIEAGLGDLDESLTDLDAELDTLLQPSQ